MIDSCDQNPKKQLPFKKVRPRKTWPSTIPTTISVLEPRVATLRLLYTKTLCRRVCFRLKGLEERVAHQMLTKGTYEKVIMMQRHLIKRTLELGLIVALTAGCGEDISSDQAVGTDAEIDTVDATQPADDPTASDSLSFSPLSDSQDVVAWVDLTRYVGQWFEIATTPSQQQRVCAGTKAIYSPGEDERINVTNQCNRGSLDGNVQTIDGYAESWTPRPKQNWRSTSLAWSPVLGNRPGWPRHR